MFRQRIAYHLQGARIVPCQSHILKLCIFHYYVRCGSISCICVCVVYRCMEVCGLAIASLQLCVRVYNERLNQDECCVRIYPYNGCHALKRVVQSVCHSLTMHSLLLQFQILFQSELSTECDQVLPLPSSSIF